MSRRSGKTSEEARGRFIAELALGGTVAAACQAAGIGRRTAYDLRERDESFAAEWEDAIEAGTDVIEQEAFRRAVQGTERRIYDKEGNERGVERTYSDRLLELLLKARRPHKYRERVDVRHSGQVKQLSAQALAAERDAGLDPEYEDALAKVASLDAARQRRREA
jgi:hypothetical protein